MNRGRRIPLDRKKRASPGAALVMVLLLIAILSVICAEVLYELSIHKFIIVNQQRKLRARYIAKAGQNAADTLLLYKDADDAGVFNIPEAPFFRYSCLSSSLFTSLGLTSEQEKKQEEMLADVQNMENCGRWSLAIPYVLDEIPLDLEITDEQAKLNLNALIRRMPAAETDPLAGEVNFENNEPLFHAVFELFRLQVLRHEIPISDDEIMTMLIQLRDYIDYGNVNGSFDTDQVSYFEYGTQVIKMKQGPLDSLEEIRFLPGMDDKLFEAVKPYLTVYPTGQALNVPGGKDAEEIPDLAGSHFDPRVNVSSAPVEVIYALLMAASYLGDREPTLTIEQALEYAHQVVIDNYTKNQVQFPILAMNGKPTGLPEQPATTPATPPLATLAPKIKTAFDQMSLAKAGGRTLRFWRIRSSALTDDGFETTITTVVKVNKAERSVTTLYFRED